MTDIVCRLRALRERHSYLDWSDRLTEAADEIERLRAENRNLKDELFDYYSQNKCGCGHPACKRCLDDRFVEDALAAHHKGGEK